MMKNVLLHTLPHGTSLIRQHFLDKGVLLVLDDVNVLEQLEALDGENHWFGWGVESS